MTSKLMLSERNWWKDQAGNPIVYQTATLPLPFRIKLAYALTDGIGDQYEAMWDHVRGKLFRQKGLETLVNRDSPMEDCIGYIRWEDSDVAITLDLIETCCDIIDSEDYRTMLPQHKDRRGIRVDSDQVLRYINNAFRRHGVGYQFENGELMPYPSPLLHEEVVIPAIRLMNDSGFEGAIGEFMRAFGHHREGDNHAAMVEANNAFESVVKTICQRRGVQLAGNERPDQLINAILGVVIPRHLANGLTGLRSTMQALPTLRSNTPGAGHGAGPSSIPVTDHATVYALHMAAANVVFLIEAYRELERAVPGG